MTVICLVIFISHYINNFLIPSIAGLSNDNTNISYISNDRESDSTKYLHENENNRKSYPQRNNRSRLNYRDLERGMYEEIRQSMWNFSAPMFINKNNDRFRNDGEHEIIDLSMDDDDDDNVEKSTNVTDQMHRHLWCICQKPWDHSKLMLRCNSCANWYHGDCIGVSAKEMKALEIDGDQFICPLCRSISSSSTTKRAKSSEESIAVKRKYPDETASVQRNEKNISNNTSKSNTVLQRNLPKELKTHCIVHSCTNWAKSDWVYCSSACIRRHINETLQSIQKSKGMNDIDIPTSDDITLYESKSKKILDKNSVPKIEDLSIWINQHPSYQIIKSSLRQSISSTNQQSKDLTQSSSHPIKPKSSLTSISINQNTNTKSSIPNKNKLIQFEKSINKRTSNINSTSDIRSIVPQALYDKITMRLERNGEKHLLKDDIRTRVNQIEEEMFRVYGKVDNSYKNKGRSLLANINNTNNNFFYKQILSKDLTAKQIVAMKSNDMLPPEEKEKRNAQFEKEIQMIMKSEEEKAAEMARRMKTKLTKQGLVDNDAHYSSIDNSVNLSGEEIQQSTMKKIESNNQLESLPSVSLTKKINSNPSSKIPIVEEINPIIPTIDLDNDYIEPESPTGIDALIYDEEDNDNDLNTSSQSSINHSPIENLEDILPYQPIIRDDYNPLKAKNETPTTTISSSTSIARLSNQWHGFIHTADTKFSCQSVHIYGENNYLIKSIPEQLLILGRLRLNDLWDYIRDSLAVRDILILTLTSSSLNIHDNELFVQYVDTLNKLGRAAVINKCTNSSVIRDIYILAADTKECPSNVLSTLFLPTIFESKQLFLVIIGTGKRTIKSINHSNQNQLLNNLTYKPVIIQESNVTRDPRLLKNKNSINTKQTTNNSNENLLKLISDSLQRIRQSSTIDTIRSIVISTIETLKANKRDDLNTHFNDNLRVVLTEWQTIHGYIPISIPSIVVGDNLIEENMDVDDDQDDKQKKQVIINSNSSSSSSSHSTRELNDIDYRFVNHNQITKTTESSNHRKSRRKSRFSDVLPMDVKKSKSSIEKNFPKIKEDKSTNRNTTLRVHNTKISSPELIDKHINPFKFQPFIPSINTKDNFISNSKYQQETKTRFSNDWKSKNNHNYYMTHYHDFDQPQE